jgi:hypothetical protein
MPRLAVLHSTPVVYELFRTVLGSADCFHLIDEALLRDVQARGIDADAVERVGGHVSGAAASGATTFLCTCSSLSPAMDLLPSGDGPERLNIDDPACEEIAAAGGRIGVVASVRSTVKPTTERILGFAARLGTDCTIVPILADGAFALRNAGDLAAHDRMVTEAVAAHAGAFDRLLIAQASVAHLAPALAVHGKPVVTTIDACLRRLGLQSGS